MIESERDLQDYFLKLLENNSFNFIQIKNEDELKSNFKKQIELFNNTSLNDNEFSEIYNYLVSNSSFDKLKSNSCPYNLIDFDDFESNIFQVTEEVKVKSDYTNRYDVTILINGIPFIQIELKKPGVDLKEAFNQIKRYDAHSYQGLFSYVHLFIISNNVHTRFFFNNHDFNYDNTFTWHNHCHLNEFTNSFLTINNLAKFFNYYIFKNQIDNQYYMLRPYQIEAIEKVQSSIDNNKNAYLWMTYGSGLDLTSFHLAEILSCDYKVVYVTSNSLSKYPKRFLAKNSKQFLKKFQRNNLVISHIKYIKSNIEDISDENVIYIFNDYEKQYQNYSPLILKNTCKNSLFYLFSHAPIFNDNIVLDKTTKYIFDNHIFTYNLNNFYLDKFSKDINIEIYGSHDDLSKFNLSSSLRLNKISEVISNNINSPSILITSSNEDLIKYYNIFREFNIKVAPIFRFESNDNILNKPAQDLFKDIVDNYNDDFNTKIEYKYRVKNESTMDKLENNIIKKFNNDEIDLLIIDESMFSDVFNVNIIGNLNNPKLNTIFLDCNLKYESLLHVLSIGNIVSFRDIYDDINQTIKLFSEDEPKEDHDFKDYNQYIADYTHYLSKIKDSKGEFIDNFKQLNYYYQILKSFDEFNFDDTRNNEFYGLKDKYNHVIYEIKSSKREITEYDTELLYKLIIDLNYVNSIKRGKSPEIIKITSKKEENPSDEIPVEKESFKTSPKKDESGKEVSIEPKKEKPEENVSKIMDESQNSASKTNNDVGTILKTINYDKESSYKKNNSSNKLNGDIMSSSDDFIKSLNPDFDVKICPECGKEFESDANFCDSCQEAIKLVYKKDLVKECPCCGAKYPKDYNFCVKCHCEDKLNDRYQFDIKKIKSYPNEYYNDLDHTNRFGNIQDLLNENNLIKLQKTFLDYNDYEIILSKIKSTYQKILTNLINEYSININELSILDKMLLFAKSFVVVKFKSGGGDLGNFAFNEINIDDRNYTHTEITTIIHELSHFILAEIFEQTLMIILDSDKTDAIEAFVCEILLSDFNYLVDEYCAHTVEGRFASLGYQNYGSFHKEVNDYPKDAELSINRACLFGNTFSKGIIEIMESYINEDLREEIKEEYKDINEQPDYDGLAYETNACLDDENITRAINIMINYGINNCDINKLEVYTDSFRKNNSKR